MWRSCFSMFHWTKPCGLELQRVWLLFLPDHALDTTDAESTKCVRAPCTASVNSKILIKSTVPYSQITLLSSSRCCRSLRDLAELCITVIIQHCTLTKTWVELLVTLHIESYKIWQTTFVVYTLLCMWPYIHRRHPLDNCAPVLCTAAIKMTLI